MMAEANSEPTMEEILSSIKKIIAEDNDKSLSVNRPRRSVPRDASHDEFGSLRIVSSDTQMSEDASAAPVAATVATPAPADDDDILELTEMAIEDSNVASIAPHVAPTAPVPEIVSPVAVTATRNAFDSLSALIVKPEVAGTDTLEGMVREMLKPMLKEWLDARLPEVVEAMVAKEIARISGR
jgi:uncharacterized protein